MRIKQFHDSVEVLVVVEVNGERAFATTGTLDFNVGLQGLAQLRLGSAVGVGQLGFG